MSDQKELEAQAPAKASHDTAPPQALVEFMMQGWKEPPRRPGAKVSGLARHVARRAALSARFPGEALVIPTGHEKVRANDTTYRFRPASDFYYLTGNPEPDCVLVLAPRKGGGHASVLFVEPEVDRSTPAFFTDRARGALWVGPRLGLAGSRARYGVDEALALKELEPYLADLSAREVPRRGARGLSPQVDRLLAPAADEGRDKEFAFALASLRLHKDAAEVAALEKAIAATKLAYEGLLRALRSAKTERALEVAFDAQARLLGHGVGYGTIVAGGPHATILHWTHNDGPIERGKLVLIDAGVEGEAVYTADITRTFPVSGKFTREQRAIYDLVTEAQDAAIEAVRPGDDFVEPHRAAMRILAHGLSRLGILREDPEEALREDRQTYKRYTLHNTSHMLGLDVHDNAAANYRPGKLEPGMVLTIEPGLYLQREDRTVPPRFRGIGIRVEEDVLVTRSGCRVLSASIPRKSKEVEAWIARLWSKRR
jgi:Xaa-Pro aminopeptidase